MYLSRAALKISVEHLFIFRTHCGMALNNLGPLTDRLAKRIVCTRTLTVDLTWGTMQERPVQGLIRLFMPKFGTRFSNIFHTYIIIYLSLLLWREYSFKVDSCSQ